MSDISDLRWAIVPKSDQLNAEQLLAGPMTLEVTDVRIGSDDQPVVIHYRGDNGRPYKPCKTMRKLLIFAWGEDGRRWIGRAMTVYNDPNVRFGGQEVGGIRISHLTDIPRPVQVSLTATKGKKALHTIQPLQIERSAGDASAIANAQTVDELKAAFGAAYKATKDAAARARLKASYDARMAELTAPPTAGSFDPAQFIARVQQCADLATLQLMSDEAEELPPGDDRDRIMQALHERDQQLAAAGQ